jgi:hypothetical protein
MDGPCPSTWASFLKTTKNYKINTHNMKTFDPTEHLDIEVIGSGFEDYAFTEWEKDVIPTDAEGIEDEDMM